NKFFSFATAGATSTGVPSGGAPASVPFHGLDSGIGFSGDAAMNIAGRRTQAAIRHIQHLTTPTPLLDAGDPPALAAIGGPSVAGNNLGIGGAFAGNALTAHVKAYTSDVTFVAASVSLQATAAGKVLSFADGGSATPSGGSVAGSAILVTTDDLAL